MLNINEEFVSIQGEGMHTGVPMYFLRLQGCNVGCYFCDTKYTWKPSNGKGELEENVINRVQKTSVAWLCITGGEPYEQDLRQLTELAKHYHIKTHIETSGEIYQDIDPTWICLSPKDRFTKQRMACKEEMKEAANEIKCVVTKPEDVDYYLLNYYQYCGIKKPFILQPVDNDIRLIKVIEEKIRHLHGARLMLQCQKIMQVR